MSQLLPAVYRVWFEGDDLSDAAIAALREAEVWWEGSASGPKEPSRHRVLVDASTEHDAIEAVRKALEAHGSFDGYRAVPVTNARGEVWRGPFYKKWQEVDWQATPERARLTDLQRAVLGAIADAAEPTWIVYSAPDVTADRSTVEAVLEDLEAQGLIYSTLEQSGERGRETEIVRWWAMTHETWDMVGFIRSPGYH